MSAARPQSRAQRTVHDDAAKAARVVQEVDHLALQIRLGADDLDAERLADLGELLLDLRECRRAVPAREWGSSSASNTPLSLGSGPLAPVGSCPLAMSPPSPANAHDLPRSTPVPHANRRRAHHALGLTASGPARQRGCGSAPRGAGTSSSPWGCSCRPPGRRSIGGSRRMRPVVALVSFPSGVEARRVLLLRPC